MSVELYINDFRVPLSSASITLNKQANNLAELRDRQATYTNKFKAKKTPKLIQFFDNLGIVGNTSRIPYKVLFSKLLFNGVEVVTNGNAYITSSNNFDYFITIYDGNIFLFQEIGNKKLSELNLAEYQHQLTELNYVNSFSNTEGYIYAISDNGKISSSLIEINYQLFSIFVSTVWAKIFEGTSYGYTGDIFNSYKFKNLVITPKRGYNAEVDLTINPVSVNQTVSYSNSSVNHPLTDLFNSAGYQYNFYLFTSEIFPINNFYINQGVMSVSEAGQYLISLDLNFTNVVVQSFVTYNVRIIKTPANIFEDDFFYEQEFTTTLSDYNLQFATTINTEAGDSFIVLIRIYQPEITSSDTTSSIIYVSGTSHFGTVSDAILDLSLNAFIGDLTQAAFIKAIMQHFGLMFQPIYGENVYEFKRIQDVLLNTKNSVDWSDKYVSTAKETYQLKGYAQKNRMGYLYFDTNSDKFADDFLIVDNKNLKPEATSFTSPFNACDISGTLINNSNITSTKFWEAIRNDAGVIERYKPINSNNYLAEIKRTNETISYGFVNGTVHEETGLIPRLDFKNLNYSTIISENYSRLKVILDWNNVRQVKIRLTAKEIKEFDFFNLVYIDKLGSLFYVNKISYKGKTTANAEVVQVKKIPYECDLVANSGSYPIISKSVGAIQLDGNSSQGNITTWLWQIISEPSGSAATITNQDQSIATLNGLDVVGDYKIRLTISNIYCSKVSNVIITMIT